MLNLLLAVIHLRWQNAYYLCEIKNKLEFEFVTVLSK